MEILERSKSNIFVALILNDFTKSPMLVHCSFNAKEVKYPVIFNLVCYSIKEI